jgi:hypothetical protein
MDIDSNISITEAGIIVDFVRKHIDAKFNRIFKFKDSMIKIIKRRIKAKETPILLNLQGNLVKYSYYKTKSSKFRIKSNIFNSKIDNKIEIRYVIDTIDSNKISNTILTTLVHSLDSKVNVIFRTKFLEIYGVKLSCVHDRFSNLPPYLYKESCRLYKKVLYDHIFHLKLKDIYLINEGEIDEFKSIQLEIDNDKTNNLWKIGLLDSESYALYPE